MASTGSATQKGNEYVGVKGLCDKGGQLLLGGPAAEKYLHDLLSMAWTCNEG